MDDMLDISDLNFPNEGSGGGAASKYGGGIELLMNPNKIKDNARNYFKTDGGSGGGDNDDMLNLEQELQELNDLGENGRNGGHEGGGGSTYHPTSSLFSSDNEDNYNSGSGNNDNGGAGSIRFQDKPFMGQAASDAYGEEPGQTWDGYGKFNEIPVLPDRNGGGGQRKTPEELMKDKYTMLRKLQTLKDKGYKLSKEYTFESSYMDMEAEYKSFEEEKRKQNAIQFQSNMFVTCIQGIEFLNDTLNPFDIDISGLSESVSEDKNTYDEIFEELYEKYKGRVSMAPELKLLFAVGGSAVYIAGQNKMRKMLGLGRGMNDVFNQYPDAGRIFEQSLMQSMIQENQQKQQQQFMGQNPMLPNQHRGPPPPMATKELPQQTDRSGNNNSADSFAFKSPRPPMGSNGGSGPGPGPQKRSEMVGPRDLSGILSGLKTKTIQINGPSSSKKSAPSQPYQYEPEISASDDGSIMSDVISLSGGGNGGEGQKSKKRRKPKSASSNLGQTISIDL